MLKDCGQRRGWEREDVHRINGLNYSKEDLIIQANRGIALSEGMKGTANILFSDKSVLKKMFNL